jgi:hypothetical protein
LKTASDGAVALAWPMFVLPVQFTPSGLEATSTVPVVLSATNDVHKPDILRSFLK